MPFGSRFNYPSSVGSNGLEKLASALLGASSTTETGSGGRRRKAASDAQAPYEWKKFEDSTILRYGLLFLVTFLILNCL